MKMLRRWCNTKLIKYNSVVMLCDFCDICRSSISTGKSMWILQIVFFCENESNSINTNTEMKWKCLPTINYSDKKFAEFFASWKYSVNFLDFFFKNSFDLKCSFIDQIECCCFNTWC